MTIEEIFTRLNAHMREGVSLHKSMSVAYDFLGLYGFARFHTHQAEEEMDEMLHLYHYYATHYFKLVKQEPLPQSTIIPETWYKYTTMDVDVNTKRNSIKDLMTKWIDWEKSTKELYQSLRQELIATNEVAFALELDHYILDVSNELEYAQKKLNKLNSINYDLVEIESWQQPMSKKYKKKLGW